MKLSVFTVLTTSIPLGIKQLHKCKIYNTTLNLSFILLIYVYVHVCGSFSKPYCTIQPLYNNLISCIANNVAFKWKAIPYNNYI